MEEIQPTPVAKGGDPAEHLALVAASFTPTDEDVLRPGADSNDDHERQRARAREGGGKRRHASRRASPGSRFGHDSEDGNDGRSDPESDSESAVRSARDRDRGGSAAARKRFKPLF